jgi:peptidoglycan/LPS O-acetylase OafA/YrhL
MKIHHRFLALDGLRGVAAICVVVFHGLGSYGIQGYLPHAHLAVDFFFMLSGFVISSAYTHRLACGMTFRQFLLVRWIRLFPLYAVGLLLGLAIFCAKMLLQRMNVPGMHLGKVFFLALWFLPSSQELGQGWGTAFPLDPPAWSLFFEWLANIAWSTALISVDRWRQAILLFILGAGYFAQSIHFGGVRGGNFYNNLDLGLLRVAFPFLAGVMLFAAKPKPTAEPGDLGAVTLGAFLIALMALPSAAIGIPQGVFEGVAVCVAFPSIIFLGSKMFPTRRTAKVMSWLGEISYAIYIVHYPLIHMLNNLARAWATSLARVWLLVMIQLGIMLAASHVLMRLWDIPVRAYLSRRLLERPGSLATSAAPIDSA